MKIKIKDYFSKAKSFLFGLDYRHYINAAITLVFFAFGIFVFPNAICRLIEAVRDFCLSCAYYACELVMDANPIIPTVNNLPSWQIASSRFQPLNLLPFTWEEFQVAWSEYWTIWASLDTLQLYGLWLADVLYVVSQVILIVIPFVLWMYVRFQRYLKEINNYYEVESPELKRFKRIADLTYIPIRNWIRDYIAFMRENAFWYKIWLWLWAFYFNVITIVVEFIAFYLYFVVSCDFVSIYRQVYKLLLDLSTVIRFVPVPIWVITAVVVLELIARHVGYDGLYHRELCNRGFVNERGVVTIVYGEMGVGKTALITDCMLSADVQLRDDAYEIILESDMKFPNFTWVTFERQLRQAIYFHVIYDVWSCRRWVRKKYTQWQKATCKEKIFGYDYERYGLTYDDKLKEVNVWNVLEDYACAYLIYTVQSSFIVANYSVRVDSLLYDLDNFPLWNSDFFKRDSRLLDSFSRHCKILDFDMLRLGKIMLENNPNRNAYGFGVYGITELDKERKNTPELKDVKADSDECNQKNDLFNILLKMSRHACVIANRVFVKVFADLQRPDSLGSDCRELGEVSYIEEKTSIEPVLPFFAPYYIFELFIDLLFKPFQSFYKQYRFNRSDNTLFLYLYKNLEAKLQHIKERTRNVFGSATLSLELQSGRMDGEPKKRKWYRMPKKIYSRRYTTDCQQAIFERRAENNFVGIDDLREYADDMANGEELIYQKSHMQVELLRCVA